MQYHPAKGGKGKQHGCFSSFLDITRGEFHKIVQISSGEGLLLVFRTFCHVVYATKGFTLPFHAVSCDLISMRLPANITVLSGPFLLGQNPNAV
jgi:hypothetical protein